MQQLTTNYTLHYVKYTGIWLRTIKWSLPSVGWQRKAVQGPGDLWCWIPSSGALQGYSRARLQRLFDKRIEQHRWCVCEQRKQDQDTYISRYPSFLTFFPFPTTLVLCSRFIRLQRSIWSTRGYETAREISKEIPSTEEEKFFFFFFDVATRHRLDFRSRWSPSVSIGRFKTRMEKGGTGSRRRKVESARPENSHSIRKWPRRDRIHLVKNDTREG